MSEEKMERSRLRKIVGVLMAAAGFGLLLLAMAGCAQLAHPVQGICAVMPLGQNESGVQFIRYQCEPDQEAKS